EWTVRVEEAEFHLGVHNIDPARVEEAERAMAAFTGGRHDRDLGEILDWIAETPSAFVVLNHPFWDMAGIGALKHEPIPLPPLPAPRHPVHGLESHGYPQWAQNRPLLPPAE